MTLIADEELYGWTEDETLVEGETAPRHRCTPATRVTADSPIDLNWWTDVAPGVSAATAVAAERATRRRGRPLARPALA